MGEPKITAFFYHLLCIIRDEVTYKVFVSMLILIAEDLTCICKINDTSIQLRTHKNTCGHPITVSTNTVLSFRSFFPIPVKSKYWMEKTSTTIYCQLWSQSPRKSARPPPPPPILSSGPFVSQSWTSAPMSAGKTDAADMWTDTPKNILSVGCASACGASIAAAQNKQPAQVLSCDSKGDFSVIIYSSWGVTYI